MEIRRFKPGDRVVQRNNDQVMEVLHYEVEHPSILRSRHDVKCVWYEEGERKTGVFDERTLKKTTKHFGLYKT